MSKITSLMERILDFEMRRVYKLDHVSVENLPRYSDNRKGPFIIAFWREKDQTKDEVRVIVQVIFRRCLGMSDVCAGGIKFTHGSKYLLSRSEMYDYY